MDDGRNLRGGTLSGGMARHEWTPRLGRSRHRNRLPPRPVSRCEDLALKPQTRLILICLAAYAAVSTKISNLPVAGTITLIGVHRAAAELGWRKAAGIALAVWSALYVRSFCGPRCIVDRHGDWPRATLFHSRYFGADAIAQIKAAKDLDPQGFDAAPSLACPIGFMGNACGFWIVGFAAFKRERLSLVVSGLVCGQAILIA